MTIDHERVRHLKDIEIDFIEFIARKRNVEQGKIKKQYLNILNNFQCHSGKFKDLSDQIHKLNRIIYDFKDPYQQIKTYKYHELTYILRYLSYSYVSDLKQLTNFNRGEAKKNILSNVKRGIKRLYKKPETYKFDESVLTKEKLESDDLNLQNWMKGLVYQHQKVANYLTSLVNQTTAIVDYGSGLGYLSFEIGQLYPKTKIYLVDIESLVLEFAEYRFNKHGLDVHVIPIKVEQLYPKLPTHNICIATEVMEHVIEPSTVLDNIISSLDKDGILFGIFFDHAKEEQHVSCDLSSFRNKLNKYFKQINDLVWQKVA